ncbi:MAG: hypothetical protein AB7J30_11020 [Hyphomicrobium sp.]|uniref:hypothetical protein n=1 Tax=Hyphomicrobium sp. TaxID=82 RepID=UPI003D0C22B5
MPDIEPGADPRKHQELMLRIARRPGYCCCCICLPSEDRRRARRILHLTRRVIRDWEKDRRDEERLRRVRGGR